MRYTKFIFLTLCFCALLFDSCSSDPISNENPLYTGGENYTTFNFGNNAFGAPAKGLTNEELLFFQSGNSLFRDNWIMAGNTSKAIDGIGPLLNARSCGGCHGKDGRAAPPNEFSVPKTGLLFRISVGFDLNGGPISHPIYGSQIQDQSNLPVPPEANVSIEYITESYTYPDGTPYELLSPIYTIENLAYGSIDEELYISPRIATQLAGIGLLESISESDILRQEDVGDSDSDGISGKANYVWDPISESLSLGRFGWKANQAGLSQQNASAFNGDMGLTSDMLPEDIFTQVQEETYPDIPNGGYPEVTARQLSRVNLYIRGLSIPAKRNMDTPEYQRGELLFKQVNCNSCHVESYLTTSGNNPQALDNQRIYPYTDLLLHDMGPGLADGYTDFSAGPTEWRTPPLWGIGLIPVVNNHTRLLHDGRARNIEEAILWHGGEAKSSKESFMQLSKQERDDLIFFIESI